MQPIPKTELTPHEIKMAGGKPVFWKANEGRQTEALERWEFEILYGGARGGGKTEAGMAFMSEDKYRNHPFYRGLVLRRNSKDLSDWIDRAKRFFAMFGGEVVGHEIRFPSGAIIRTGHLNDNNAYSQYQGHEYQKILFEELTHIPSEELYMMVLGSCRSTVPELPAQAMSTTNPDGPGRKWVKKRFGLIGVPQDIVRIKDEIMKRWRVFVPARVEDNPKLMKADPTYVSFLASLPDGLRQQWKDGNWDEFEVKGAIYANEIAQMKREGRIKFVPYDPTLKVHTVWDLGVTPMTLWLVQRTEDKNVKVIGRYQASGEGLAHYASWLQQKQKERNYVYGKHFAPHDANAKEKGTGKTLVQTAQAIGLTFEVIARLSIEAGIEKTRLMFPRLWITTEYGGEEALDAVSQYRYKWDENKMTYSQDPLHDWTSHDSDVLRYIATIEDKMTNQTSASTNFKQKPYVPQSEFEGGHVPFPRMAVRTDFVQPAYQPDNDYEGGQ